MSKYSTQCCPAQCVAMGVLKIQCFSHEPSLVHSTLSVEWNKPRLCHTNQNCFNIPHCGSLFGNIWGQQFKKECVGVFFVTLPSPEGEECQHVK